jgi:hypothetical protein
MALTLYMDQHVPKAITVGLRLRGVDVVTAYNVPFYGVIYAHQLQVSIGACVRDLELIAQVGEPEEW